MYTQGLANIPLGIYPAEISIHIDQKTGTKIFTVTLSIITPDYINNPNAHQQ